MNPFYGFLQRNFTPPPSSIIMGLRCSHSKVNLSSLQRAKAGNPLVEIEFRQKMEEMFTDLYENDIMRYPTPSPQNIYCFDEIGSDWMSKSLVMFLIV